MKPKGSSSAKAQTEPAPVFPSFLFCVNGLPTNDNPEFEGAIDMRFSEVGRWIPPNVPEGFKPSKRGDVYLWRNGTVTAAEGYEWRSDIANDITPDGTICKSAGHGNYMLPEFHSAATVFYCNDWDQFYVSRGYANKRDMTSVFCDPEDDWRVLSFIPNNITRVSCVQLTGEERLSIPSEDWLLQLIPGEAYQARADEVTGQGLSGLLSLLVALAAFSCKDRSAFRDILLQDRCWKNYRWRRHNRSHGRE